MLLDPVANTPKTPARRNAARKVKPSFRKECFRTPSPTPPDPRNHATRKASNLHSGTSAAGPRQHPQTPGATQHEGDQTFTRKQTRPDPVVDSLKQCNTKGVKPSLGDTYDVRPDPVSNTPNSESNATRKGSDLNSETSASGPGAIQHERGQTSFRKQVLLDPAANTPKPAERCNTKGVKPSLGNKCFWTPSQTPPKPPPGAMQHERSNLHSETSASGPISNTPNPRSNAARNGPQSNCRSLAQCRNMPDA